MWASLSYTCCIEGSLFLNLAVKQSELTDGLQSIYITFRGFFPFGWDAFGQRMVLKHVQKEIDQILYRNLILLLLA